MRGETRRAAIGALSRARCLGGEAVRPSAGERALAAGEPPLLPLDIEPPSPRASAGLFGCATRVLAQCGASPTRVCRETLAAEGRPLSSRRPWWSWSPVVG